MRHPSFLHGVVIAFVLAAVAGAALSVLASLFSVAFLVRFVVTGAAGAYIVYLLYCTESRVGKVTTLSLWGASVLAIWFLTPSFTGFVIAHGGLIWLVRAFYFYPSLWLALLDLGLCAVALIASVATAKHTGSAFLSLWCFFLVQALFVSFPSRIRTSTNGGGRTNTHNNHTVDSFEKAYRSADAALRRLSTQH